MCDWHDGFSEAETHGFSTSYTYSASWCETSVDTESLLARFALAQEFQAFKKLLRRAAREVSVAQFTALKRYYDSAWLEVLEEL